MTHSPFFQSESAGSFFIENLGDLLNFQIVIARSERAHFSPLAFTGVIGHRRRVATCGAAVFLDPLQVFAPPKPAFDCPVRAA